MNQDILKGRWKQLRGEAKQRWAKLTNSDLEHIAGEKDKLVGRIQERYGYMRDEAEHEVDRWYKQLSSDK